MTTAVTVKEWPILFKDAMVRAILDGRKTQTRRVMRPQPHESTTDVRDIPDTPFWYGAIGTLNDFGIEFYPNPAQGDFRWKCPYGQPGDRLWVRETWAAHKAWDKMSPYTLGLDCRDGDNLWWAADGGEAVGSCGIHSSRRGKWRRSIHMPRWASRITLEVTDVRVQRLQEISEEDAIAEGVERWVVGDGWREYGLTAAEEEVCGPPMHDASSSFRTLWDSINAKRGFGWDANPFVWAITFKKL